MRFEDIDISTILPQRPPFVFVDALVSYDDEKTVTKYTVREDSLFVEDGRFLSAGLVENMAQSSAARIGYIACYIKHIPVTIGYIGNVRNLRIYRNPVPGETITTTVILKEEIFSIVLTDIVIRCGEEVIAEASVKNALSDKTITE